jgi:hypothetical protein
MKTIETITADEFRTRLEPGKYRAITSATVCLSHGTGSSRRDIEYVAHNPGAEFAVERTVNGYWYGLEPGGEIFAPESAIVERMA